MPSKYTVTECPDGFTVEAEDRPKVVVNLTKAHFVVESGTLSYGSISLFDCHKLVKTVAQGLMSHWHAPAGLTDWLGVNRWAIGRTAFAINKQVFGQWRRLLERVGPSVRDVHRAIFAATLSTASIAELDDLYRRPYVVSDILHYRAAAIAAVNVYKLVVDERYRQLMASDDVQQLLALGRKVGAEIRFPCGQAYQPCDDQTALDALGNWRGLFSYNGEPYTSLNRTLMNLPGGIPHGLLCELPYWHLERPMKNRRELLTLLLYSCIRGDRDVPNAHIFEHANANQIQEAVSRIAEHTHTPLNPNKTRDLKTAVHFLADYPERHTGHIVGLADKSILWHRDQNRQNVTETLERLGAETLTATPPIPLPDDRGIRFLASVEEVCQEGLDMQHCVATYAERAVRGDCYLFSAERDGERATVEVTPAGWVLQALGVRNSHNGAAKWAKRILSQWGRQFPGYVANPYGSEIPL